MESCYGEDNMKQYIVNMKKAVAKCSQQDAPELNLPPFRNTYRFINTMLTNADQMEDNKMMKLFHIMDKMKKTMMKELMEKMFDHSSSNYDSSYDSSYDYNYDHSSNMFNDDSSSFRKTMAALLSRNKRDAAKGQPRPKGQARNKNAATTAASPLDIGDKLVEKLKHQQEEMEQE